MEQPDPSVVLEFVLFQEQVAAATAGAFDIVQALTVATVKKRHYKTILSTREKLRRIPTLNLSEMQDMAGCRVVLDSAIEQEVLALRLFGAFGEPSLVDRRERPSHGYRAIHLIPRLNGERYEIQVRTKLQDAWARVVEAVADKAGQEYKYGGGDHRIQQIFLETSGLIERFENEHEDIVSAAQLAQDLLDFSSPDEDERESSRERLREQTRIAHENRVLVHGHLVTLLGLVADKDDT